MQLNVLFWKITSEHKGWMFSFENIVDFYYRKDPRESCLVVFLTDTIGCCNNGDIVGSLSVRDSLFTEGNIQFIL